MTSLTLPTAMAESIASSARAAGAEPVETGGFVLGPEGEPRGTVLALTGDCGIQRRRDVFAVSGLALATLFEWTADQELTIHAQWHTHRFEAFLSDVDLEHGLNVPGFLTSVVPHYEQASPDPAAWGWWIFATDGWHAAPPPAVADGTYRTVVFEEGAVHDA